MRIISGKAKGTKLKAVSGLRVRPTTDRVKESVFGILQRKINDAEVLDLFAGTGGLGLEALSRGARYAIFVDQSTTSLQVLRENAIHTKLVTQAEFLRMDVLQAIEAISIKKTKFHLIFCDPPYNQGWVEKILKKMDEVDILEADGVLILEHSKHEAIILPADLTRLENVRTEHYGETIISFFQYKEQ